MTNTEIDITFEKIRSEAKRRLQVYKTIINAFTGKIADYDYDPCIWCKMQKYSGFEEDDIKRTCSIFCAFRVSCAYILPYATCYEPSLYGKYLDQIIELNNYVVTTSSTNEPYDNKFQNMFVEMYCKKCDIEKILSFCKKEGYLYTCISDRKLVESNVNFDRKDFVTTEIAESKELLYDFPGTYDGVNDNFFIDKLAFITIEDKKIENRDLYVKLMSVLK